MNNNNLDKEILERIYNEGNDTTIEELLKSDTIDYDELDAKINEHFSKQGDDLKLQKEINKSKDKLKRKITGQKKISKFSKLIKVTSSLAAAVLVLFVCNSLVAGATDYSLFDRILQYGQNVISLNWSSADERNGASANIDMYKLLQSKCKINNTVPLLPYAIPKSMVPSQIEHSGLGNDTVRIQLQNKSRQININIRYYKNGRAKQNFQVPKGDDFLTAKDGSLKFYITKSGSWNDAEFSESDFSYTVTTNLPYDDFKNLLFSFKRK